MNISEEAPRITGIRSQLASCAVAALVAQARREDPSKAVA
jgi:hypothetical protein